MTNNIFIKSLSFLIKDLLGDILYFPVWWYSVGFTKRVVVFFKKTKAKEKELGIFLWVKNFFRPMFGQKDWQGKIISFVFRVLVLFWRIMILMFWIIFRLFFVVLWLLLPFISFYYLVYNLF